MNNHMIQRMYWLMIMAYMALLYVAVRMYSIVTWNSEDLRGAAFEVQYREREIKAPRGEILDRNGIPLAQNRPVYSVSVIHAQLKEPEKVIAVLCEVLNRTEQDIRPLVEKECSRQKIQANVPWDMGEKLRSYQLDGVMVDQDYRRWYPYEELAASVIGFTGADNQGIVGLEVEYNQVLKGTSGRILMLTDAFGRRIKNYHETIEESVAGDNLVTTLDINIQKYAEQEALKTLQAKEAKGVSIIVMNPNNGEIYAMVNAPEYNINDPFTLNRPLAEGEKQQEALNAMWRNFCVHDTYEPGSIFKTVTATSAFEHGQLKEEDTFYCPGYRLVGDRRIHCHKRTGHGAEDFRQGIMNSCNPVFMEVGLRVGANGLYETYDQLGMFQTTGIDLPGEANSIFHKKEDVTEVDLAIMSFGQSFQITPLQLIRGVSAIVNGGDLVTPHFAKYTTDTYGELVQTFAFPVQQQVISRETSERMRKLLCDVVEEGSGKNGAVEGYLIGGKTATSEKLPRGTGAYISSFVGIAPGDHPEVVTLIMIDEPKGVYYGGTIAAPVAARIYENILPYLGLEATYEQELETEAE